jgi:hypothetical protein
LYTPTDIYRASRLFLRRNLGVEGEKWYLRMRGYEVDIHDYSHHQSMSHQVTIIPDSLKPKTKITTYLVKISEVLGKSMRYKGLTTRTVCLGLYSESYGYQSADLKSLWSLTVHLC